MKTDTKEDNVKEITPSKKKLTQARLPFKIISDAAPLTDSTVSRKRKLSSEDHRVETKIGRLSKENETNCTEEIVISDDENNDESLTKEAEKTLNPLLKIVENARKKKLQKSLTPRRKSNRKSTKSTTQVNGDVTVEQTVDKNEETEKMDVDEPEESDSVSKVEKQCLETIVLDEESNSMPGSPARDISPERSSQDDSKDLTTPKRLRSSTKSVSTDLDTTASSPKLDESTNSEFSTPKRSTRSSNANQEHDSNSKLTPKQLQRKLELAKKKEEREKEKMERDLKRQEEKDERARARQEKEDLKKKEREEKDEQRRKEKEEKEKQKEMEKKLREEKEELKRKERDEKEEQKRKEREEKEEQRRKEKEAKEEEKRKKQEALDLEKLEQDIKKKKAAEAFVNFFVPKQKVDKDPVEGSISKSSMLSSFTIKADMRLAPTVRCHLDTQQKDKLDSSLVNQKDDCLYLKALKGGTAKIGSSGKTWPADDKDDDVVLIEDEMPSIEGAGEVISSETAVREKLRPKLFSFHENRRPPYWGTWRKKSQAIKPRNPFAQDETLLDYEVESDLEWEDEEGESVDGDNSDEEPGDEYEVDNEFFVPHGYLSDEEATMDGDDVLSLSPEAQKARLKHLEDEFETEMKKPTEKLKPRLYGLLYATEDGKKPEHCVDALWNYFSKLSMIMNDPTPFLEPVQDCDENDKKKNRKKKPHTEGEKSSPKSEKKKKEKIESKPKSEIKKPQTETKLNQPGINNFLKKLKDI